MDRITAIILSLTTGKTYSASYWSGYKPSIDHTIQPFERDKPVFREVVRRAVTREEWVEVEDDEDD